MAARLGLEIYEWVQRFARKLAAKPDASGIMTISNKDAIRDLSNEILTKFMKHNVPREAIQSENDVKVIYNQIKNIEDQALQHRVISPGDPKHQEITERIFGKKTGDVVDLTGKKIDTSKSILGGKNVEVDMVTDTVTKLRTMEPVAALKEANLVIGRKGKYKNLTKEQSQKILKDTDDWIFQRDPDDLYDYNKKRPFRDDPDPEDFAHGGRTGTGLNYLLGEDDQNVRMPFKKGLKVYPQASVRIGEADIENLPTEITPEIKDTTYGATIMGEKDGLYGGIEGLKIKNKIDFVKDNQTLFKDTTDDEIINFILGKKGKYGDIRLKADKDLENAQISWNLKFNEGGRVPFGLGGFNKARRAFLKAMGAGAATAGAAKSGLFGLLKSGKPITGVVTSVPIKDISGMPPWFKPLVNKVIKEGNDVTKTHSTLERQIVHKTNLPDSKTDVLVTQDLATGDVVVDIGAGKHGWAEGKFGQPVRLEYKAGEWIEPTVRKGETPSKGTKTKEEFWVEEAEFTGGHPENVKFEESTINKFGEHGSDFSEVEAFAKGKPIKTRKISSLQKEGEDLADHFSNQLPPDDFASGGRVPFVKGKIVKGIASLGKKKKSKKIKWFEEEMSALDNWSRLKDPTGKDWRLKGMRPVKTMGDLKHNIVLKYRGKIDDDLLNNILADNNEQRIAEVLATIDEALIMQGKGLGHEEIINKFKESWKRKKNATGGRVPLAGGGIAGMLGE